MESNIFIWEYLQLLNIQKGSNNNNGIQYLYLRIS